MGRERVGKCLGGEREWGVSVWRECGSVCAGRESVGVSVCKERVWECLCKQRECGRVWGGVESAFMCARRRKRMTEGEKRNWGQGRMHSYIALQNMRLLTIYN